MSIRARDVVIGTLLLLSLGVGAWCLTRDASPHAHVLVEKTAALGQVYYSCPMHPQVRRDAPGNCPICGMKLVERRDSTGRDPARNDATDVVRVQIDPRMVQNLGIRTAPVTRDVFWQRIDASGRIETDERTLRNVSVRAAGWVDALHVRANGAPVKRGERMAEVYGTTFENAQREFVLALESGERSLIDGARGQLHALGFGTAQIAELESSRRVDRHLYVLAPIDGYVMELMTREGAAVTPDVPLFQLVSHDPVWVLADVPEAQAAWIRSGREVEVRVPSLPGEVFSGTVDYVYPELDTTTRTRRARVVVGNANDVLHPGMYAEVVLFGGGKQDVLLAPSEAVIRTGHRNVVLVAEEAGRYRPVEVRLGAEGGGRTVIREGLAEGDRVVVSGQFLIDSEASLLGAYRRMWEDGDPPAGRIRQLGDEGGPSVYGDEDGASQ